MKRLIGICTAVAVLAAPAASHAAGSARWITSPSCSATVAAVTCTGRASGVQPGFIEGTGPVEVGLWASVDYTCLDPAFDVLWDGIPLANWVQGETAFHNGRLFTVTFAPPEQPTGPMSLLALCGGGFVRGPDLNHYYGVRIAIGWALANPSGPPFGDVEALSASIGTVVTQ
jgi:hypothetical protein